MDRTSASVLGTSVPFFTQRQNGTRRPSLSRSRRSPYPHPEIQRAGRALTSRVEPVGSVDVQGKTRADGTRADGTRAGKTQGATPP